MAEHLPSGPAELGAPMDYAQHEETFSRFVALTKVTVLASVITVLALAIYAFGGGGAFWLGTLLLILMMIAVTIGLAGRGSDRPLVVLTVIAFILMAISVG